MVTLVVREKKDCCHFLRLTLIWSGSWQATDDTFRRDDWGEYGKGWVALRETPRDEAVLWH